VVKAKPDCERIGGVATASLRPEVAAAESRAIGGGKSGGGDTV